MSNSVVIDRTLEKQIISAVERSAAETAERAVRSIIADGVEFRAAEHVIGDWLRVHGFSYGHNNAGYVAMYANGLYFADGEPYQWPTFHEMLAALLERIDAQVKGESL